MALSVLTGLALFCSLLFWINIKYDRYLDVNEVFYKTIAKDFKIDGFTFNNVFLQYIRPLNPFIGFCGTISGLMIIIWGLPAGIIYLVVSPEPFEAYVSASSCVLSIAGSAFFLLANRTEIGPAREKILYMIGMFIGVSGTFYIIS